MYLHVQLRLQNHLKTCQFYQEALKSGCVQLPQVVPDVINGFKRQLSVANERVETSTTSSDKRQRYIREYFDNLFTEEKQEEFERLLVQFQADNCLPDRFVEKGSTVRLFMFLNRTCATALPKRKEMTRILDKYSRVEEEEQLVALKHRVTFSGGRLNVLSDVWQNVAKMHLLGCMLAIFGTIFTLDYFRLDRGTMVSQLESKWSL